MSKDEQRKATPIFSGFIKYFPRAIAEVARLSVQGNVQHLNGQELHWDKTKSNQHLDSLSRHLVDIANGEEVDDDSQLHRAKLAWRSLAALEIYLEEKHIEEVTGAPINGRSSGYGKIKLPTLTEEELFKEIDDDLKEMNENQD